MASQKVDVSNYEALPANYNWRSEANCKGMGPDLFYSDELEKIERAKAICGRCVVREFCRESAIQNRESHGVWGGVDEKEMRSIVRRRLVLRRRNNYQ